MPSFGNFEAVSELYRGGLGRVWSARGVEGDGGEPAFAVKTCEPNVAVVGERAAAEAVKRFVAQARVQLEVTRHAAGGGEGGGGGATCWAPVHAIIEDESATSAAYVTDLFSRSAERLVTGRLRVDGRGLQRIIGSVVEGLLQMQERAKRGHGNLKPTNVLIDAATDLGLARVVLSDPAATADAKTGARDLRAVGDLIHRLVLHQPFTERSAWPIASSPEWSRLGRSGSAWLEIANKLLNPKGDEAPALEELKAQIEALTVKKGNKGLLIAGAAAGVLILGGSVTLAVLASGGGGDGSGGIVEGEPIDEAWKALNAKYAGWYGTLEGEIGRMDAARKATWGKDATLAGVMERVGKAAVDPAEIAGASFPLYREWALGQVPEEVRSASRSKRVREALETVAGVERALREEWPLLNDLDEKAARWEGEGFGWTSASGRVRAAVAAVRGEEAPMGRAIDGALAVSAQARALEQRWAAIEASAAVIASKGDPVLARFRDAAAAWVAGGEPADGALVDEGRLAQVEEQAGRLKAFVETGWAEFDHDTFVATNELYKRLADGGSIGREEFEQWLHAASTPEAKLPQGADPRRQWEITDRAGAAHDLLHEIARELGVAVHAAEGDWAAVEAATELSGSAERHGGALEEAARLLAQARDHASAIHVDELRWTRGTADTIRGRMAEADESVEQARLKLADVLQRIRLDKRTTLEEVRSAIAQRREISPSAAVNAAWEAGKTALLARYSAEAGLSSSDLRLEAEGLEQSLKQIADAGGALPENLERTGLVQHVDEALRVKRERAIEAALAGLRGADGSLPPPGDAAYASAATQVREQVGEWVDSAVAMAGDLRAASDRLNLGYGLEEGAEASPGALFEKWAGNEVFVDAFGEGGPSPLSERIAGLQRVEEMSGRAALSAEIMGAQQGRQERAIAAYRRLGEFPATTVEELAGELALADRLKLALDDVEKVSRARREELEAELADARRARWRSFAESAETAAALTGALDLRASFGVDLSREAMGEGLFVDAQVYAFAGAVNAAGEDDDRARGAAEAFVASIESASLSRGVLEQEPLKGILAGVKGVLSGEEVAPPRVDPTKIGPGALEGWTGVEEPDGRVVFTHAGTGLALEFVRVEGSGSGGELESFYVMTTELSLGQFAAIDAISGGQAGGLLSRAMGQYWSGPLVWRRNDRGQIVPNAYWLQESPIYQTMSAYAAGLGDPANRRRIAESQGAPAEGMPMQYMPASAALLAAKVVGCRLPTSAEWLATLREVGGGQESGRLGANLRDATWTQQQGHVAAYPSNPTGVTFPDEGAFLAAGVRVGQQSSATAWPGLNDGTLWFRPVRGATTGTPPGAMEAVEGLVGNVAEWVYEDAAAMDGLTDVAGALTFLVRADGGWDPQKGAHVRVIGGSALSAPELQVDVPQKPQDVYAAATAGYADVGARFVFPARGTGRETLGDKLAGVLGESPYLTAGR